MFFDIRGLRVKGLRDEVTDQLLVTNSILHEINIGHFSSAFGFCDYGDPEASLRAIRLLHGKELGDKALVVSKGY